MITYAQVRQMARRHADYWTLAHRQDRLRNWIALTAMVAGTLGIAIGKFLL